MQTCRVIERSDRARSPPVLVEPLVLGAGDEECGYLACRALTYVHTARIDRLSASRSFSCGSCAAAQGGRIGFSHCNHRCRHDSTCDRVVEGGEKECLIERKVVHGFWNESQREQDTVNFHLKKATKRFCGEKTKRCRP